MQLRIKGLVYNYTSDFKPADMQGNVTRNWKVSAGDYFKFPVPIGPVNCFVKRFAKQSKEISGYNFLQAIKGKKLPGLPEVYDLVHITEEGKEVIYLFTEYLPGNTIDHLQREGFSFLPVKLASELFTALQSIHTNGYWFPDFDPKNFFRSTSGDFYIIDLDSVYPLSAQPSPAMHGSKDYWGPVYDYYRKYAGFNNDDVKKIKGDVFNNLNLIYLCGLYSSFLDGPAEDLTAPSIFQLNDYLPRQHKLFSSTMLYCCNKDSQGNFNQRTLSYNILHNLIGTVLFPDFKERTISNLPKTPQISKFTLNGIASDSLEISPGEPVTLEWTTKNATHVTLLPAKKQLDTSGKLELRPDGDIKYTLQAVYKHKKGSPTANQSCIIQLLETDWKRPVINFFIQGKERNYFNCPKNATYKLSWSVFDADKVYLDNVEVPNNSYKEITCTRDTNHILRAENIKKGRSKSNAKTLSILTESKPNIQFSVSPRNIIPGESVQLAWNVTNGKNIFITQNGSVIAKNCMNTGSMKISLGLVKGKSTSEEFTYKVHAYTTSGNYHFVADLPQVVVVKKRSSKAGWVVTALLLIGYLIYLLTKFAEGIVFF